jgi:hypothetical protein
MKFYTSREHLFQKSDNQKVQICFYLSFQHTSSHPVKELPLNLQEKFNLLKPKIYFIYHQFNVARGGAVVKALRYKPESRGIDSR